MQVVLSYYIQSPQWQSHSCSERMVVVITVVCFISVLYMMIGKKSRLFGSIAGRIFTGRDSFAITVWTVSKPGQIDRHKSHHFVFARFVPTFTFDGMLHTVSLTYIYNAIALKRVYKRNPPKRVSWWFLLRGISYPRQCLGCQRINAIVCIY